VKVVKGENDKEITDAGLRSHGLVGKSADGTVVTAIEGHMYGKKKVTKVMEDLLAAAKE